MRYTAWKATEGMMQVDLRGASSGGRKCIDESESEASRLNCSHEMQRTNTDLTKGPCRALWGLAPAAAAPTSGTVLVRFLLLISFPGICNVTFTNLMITALKQVPLLSQFHSWGAMPMQMQS